MGYVPSVWFLALYDVICGRPSPAAAGPAALAAAATIAVTIAAVGLFVTTHTRLTTRALETRAAAGHTNRLVSSGRMVGEHAAHPEQHETRGASFHAEDNHCAAAPIGCSSRCMPASLWH